MPSTTSTSSSLSLSHVKSPENTLIDLSTHRETSAIGSRRNLSSTTSLPQWYMQSVPLAVMNAHCSSLHQPRARYVSASHVAPESR
eukprot:scaffold284363_cov32-Tisochrysis_lutea.AAC.1